MERFSQSPPPSICRSAVWIPPCSSRISKVPKNNSASSSPDTIAPSTRSTQSTTPSRRFTTQNSSNIFGVEHALGLDVNDLLPKKFDLRTCQLFQGDWKLSLFRTPR